jgi:hypothetical protein
MIRGCTRLANGPSLFAALGVAGPCLTLLPDPRAAGALPAGLLQMAQWLSVGLVQRLRSRIPRLYRDGSQGPPTSLRPNGSPTTPRRGDASLVQSNVPSIGSCAA